MNAHNKASIISIILAIALSACTSNSYEGAGLNKRAISPLLASIRTIHLAGVTCKSANCPSDLSAYQKGVERGVKQRSDFALASSPSSADAELSVVINSLTERSGSAYGSDTQAGVSFEVILKKDKSEIWRDVVAANDHALTDNILKINEAKFNWLTTPELFSKQIGQSLHRLSKDRQGLFTK